MPVGVEPDDRALLSVADSPEVQAHLGVANTGVYIVRADGHIVWASPSMLEVTGRSPEDLVGKNGWDVFVPPEHLHEVARFRALLSTEDGTVWMPIPMPGGGRKWFRIDTGLRKGGIMCAFHAENDHSMQHIHYAMRPRPRRHS